LMNEKREWLNNIEAKSEADVVLIPNKYMDTPAYEIRRVRDDEAQLPENSGVSHQMAVAPVVSVVESVVREKPATAEPAVVSGAGAPLPAPPTIPPPTPPPTAVEAPAAQIGIFVQMWRWLFGTGQPPQDSLPAPASARSDYRRPERQHGRPTRNHRDR